MDVSIPAFYAKGVTDVSVGLTASPLTTTGAAPRHTYSVPSTSSSCPYRTEDLT